MVFTFINVVVIAGAQIVFQSAAIVVEAESALLETAKTNT
jgi:hypothetical protein